MFYSSMNLVLSSPLEQFEVVNFISISAPILGYLNISLTNLGLYSIMVLFLVLSLHILGNNENKLVPSYWSLPLESSYASVHSMVKSQIGIANEQYLPFIYSLFFFILISNLVSNVPYNYALTTSLIVSLGLSITIWIGVTILGLYKHRVHFFSFFIPSGTPGVLVPLLVLIEFISYVARAFSLGVRLFANLVAGHTLLKILSGLLTKLFTSGVIFFILTLIPFSIFVALCGLEIAVSIIQSYVWCILTCSYLKDAIDLH
jgi:F-type H+-transporting ATPase subunit a|uniref:ATP synthase subunit a n=1 Tax=Cantharellus appalachiensis TaxID=409893 RepID=A0A2U3TML1_9AGAM|nr:ATP synthase F0 subunit a [Cantharellus appalachiensis]AWA82094.1 ATP synthase F0 subunit a [Cantharellus appalachiensis]